MQEYQNNMNDLDKCLVQNSQLKKDLQKADMIAVDKMELTRTKSALAEKEVELKDVTNKLNDQNICKLCMENKLEQAGHCFPALWTRCLLSRLCECHHVKTRSGWCGNMSHMQNRSAGQNKGLPKLSRSRSI